jgi:hypothetical protein
LPGEIIPDDFHLSRCYSRPTRKSELLSFIPINAIHGLQHDRVLLVGLLHCTKLRRILAIDGWDVARALEVEFFEYDGRPNAYRKPVAVVKPYA